MTRLRLVDGTTEACAPDGVAGRDRSPGTVVPLRAHAVPAQVPPEHVYERHVHVEAPGEAALLRRASRLLQECERITCSRAGRRLVLTAERERDLARAVEILRDALGEVVRSSVVYARLRDGASGPETPVLGVQVRRPAADVDRVRRDLQRRGGRIVEAASDHGPGVVRALVPAVHLLGYARQLAELTSGRAVHTTWLSHHEPVAPEPPAPA